MPKRIKQEKRPKDVNELANHLVHLSTSEDGSVISPPTKAQVSMFMAALGRKGGKIGGKRRLKTMTSEERSLVAQKAARARWGTKRK
jgi:hypothetical protein